MSELTLELRSPRAAGQAMWAGQGPKDRAFGPPIRPWEQWYHWSQAGAGKTRWSRLQRLLIFAARALVFTVLIGQATLTFFASFVRRGHAAAR